MNKKQEQQLRELATAAQYDPEWASMAINDIPGLVKDDAQTIQEFDAAVLSTLSLRNLLLLQTDWMVMPDSSLSEEDMNVLVEFRTALRNAPQQEGFYTPDEENYASLPSVPDFKYSKILQEITGDFDYVDVEKVTPEDVERNVFKGMVNTEDEFHSGRGTLVWERVERVEGEKPPAIGSE